MSEGSTREVARLPDGIVAFVKRDCPTCELVAPVLAELAGQRPLTVYTQDDPGFPPGLEAEDDVPSGASRSTASSSVTPESSAQSSTVANIVDIIETDTLAEEVCLKFNDSPPGEVKDLRNPSQRHR